MNQTQNSKLEEVFLAMTPLEEFWNKEKRVIFLGEWCVPYGHKKSILENQIEIVTSPFDKNNDLQSATDYIFQLYEQVLPAVADSLNNLHETNFSKRYWRIIIGPWLMYYLSSTYDRYMHLKNALRLYPNCSTIVLSEKSFKTSYDTFEFICNLREDSFNLQIYSKILRALGQNFPEKHLAEAAQEHTPKLEKKSLLSGMKKIIFKMLSVIVTARAPIVILDSSYFSKSVVFQLILRTYGKVFPLLTRLPVIRINQYNLNLRKKIPYKVNGLNEFESLLSNMLFFDMPLCYIEDFHVIRAQKQKYYPKDAKAIFSANSWYYNETFKAWSAELAERGTVLLGSQHGGNYGSLANMPSENHELAILDYFYSWGWERFDCKAKVKAMPASKLMKRKVIGANNNRKGLLLALTEYERYLNIFPDLPKRCLTYTSRQLCFVNCLQPKLRQELRVRPHTIDCGWNIAKRLKDSVDEILIETREKSFIESLENCKLYICDHLSTTFIEALSVNKPTILFWDFDETLLRTESIPYYELLKKNGILFNSPEGAASAVNIIYEDIESWWRTPERQEAVMKFCNHFALTSDDSIDIWVKEYKKISMLVKNN